MEYQFSRKTVARFYILSMTNLLVPNFDKIISLFMDKVKVVLQNMVYFDIKAVIAELV